jgi:hypothetical protein
MSQGDIKDALTVLEERRTEGRRAFFTRAGGGGLALVVGGIVAACGASPKASTGSKPKHTKAEIADLNILNLALTAEYLAVDAYTRATGSGQFSGVAQSTMLTFRSQEQQHVDALVSAVNSMQGTPAKKPSFTYPSGTFASPTSIIKLALAAEAAFVGAYLGAIPQLSTPDLKQSAATIGFTEGEHRVTIRALAQMTPYVDLAFEKPITAAQATSIVDSFVKKS